eukprot:Sspe_Gene.91326::Locus_62793_Transcript_1_1_Confidence_1.000_Length_334::g.91326::m.91326
MMYGMQGCALVLLATSYYKEDLGYWTHASGRTLLEVAVVLVVAKILVDGACEAYLVFSKRRTRLQDEEFAELDQREMDRLDPETISCYSSHLQANISSAEYHSLSPPPPPP